MLFISPFKTITDTTKAMKSAIGNANIIPSIPIKYGKIISNGKSDIICLTSDKKAPFEALPIDVKNIVIAP